MDIRVQVELGVSPALNGILQDLISLYCVHVSEAKDAEAASRPTEKRTPRKRAVKEEPKAEVAPTLEEKAEPKPAKEPEPVRKEPAVEPAPLREAPKQAASAGPMDEAARTEAKKELMQLARGGKSVQINALIKEFGAARFSDVPPERLGALMERARAL